MLFLLPIIIPSTKHPTSSCSPFPPREQLLATAVWGAAGLGGGGGGGGLPVVLHIASVGAGAGMVAWALIPVIVIPCPMLSSPHVHRLITLSPLAFVLILSPSPPVHRELVCVVIKRGRGACADDVGSIHGGSSVMWHVYDRVGAYLSGDVVGYRGLVVRTWQISPSRDLPVSLCTFLAHVNCLMVGCGLSCTATHC